MRYKANRRTSDIHFVTFSDRKESFEKFARENGYSNLTDFLEQAALSLMLAKSVKTGEPIGETRHGWSAKSIQYIRDQKGKR